MNKQTRFSFVLFGLISLVSGIIFYFQKDEHALSLSLMITGLALLVLSRVKTKAPEK